MGRLALFPTTCVLLKSELVSLKIHLLMDPIEKEELLWPNYLPLAPSPKVKAKPGIHSIGIFLYRNGTALCMLIKICNTDVHVASRWP